MAVELDPINCMLFAVAAAEGTIHYSRIYKQAENSSKTLQKTAAETVAAINCGTACFETAHAQRRIECYGHMDLP